MKKIISIDGGGIRGIIPAVILSHVEQRLQSSLANKIDLAAGTSTGSILAAGISNGVPMEDIIKFYKEKGPSIFQPSFEHKLLSLWGLIGSKYDIEQLRIKLNAVFGDQTLDKLNVNFLSTAYNLSKGKVKFFTNKDRNVFLYEAVLASCAAPTYFTPVDINGSNYADGGLFASNPSMAAFAELKNLYNSTADDIFLFSLGTGSSLKPYKNTANWIKLQWLSPLISIMVNSDSGATHYQLTKIYQSINKKDNYFRINGNLPRNVDPAMDCATPRNMKNLLDYAYHLVSQHKYKLDKIVECLQ